MGMAPDELHFKPRIQVINQDQIDQIHSATLDVLERTGVDIPHPKALEMLSGHGARVEDDRVKIPSWMVEDAIQRAPSRVILGTRTGKRTITLERDKTYFGPSLDCVDYLDPKTHARRRFVSDNVKVTATLCDALPHLHWAMIIGMADDVPPDIADRVIARYAMEYCEKPIAFCSKDTASSKDIYAMALLLCGGKENFDMAPCLLHYSEPISPLAYFGLAVDKIIFCAQNNIPLINSSAPQAAGTAPATLAGTVVQGNAETLSGLVLHQYVKPGAPFVAGAQATVMDMRTAVFSYGACEMPLMTAALAQMAQHYRLPFFGTAGATDAKFCDAQAGAEATFQCLAAATIGSGLVHDCGSWLDHGSLASPEFMVLANEIVDAVDHFMQGLSLDEESLALDVIDRVGPRGHFLQDPHTFNNFKKIRYSEIFDRAILDQWKASGSKTFEQRLQEVTLKKMEHRPEPLPKDTVKILDEMQRGWR